VDTIDPETIIDTPEDKLVSLSGTDDAIKRIKNEFLEPASNLHVCGFIAVTSALLLLAEVWISNSKEDFLFLVGPVSVCALLLVYAVSRAGPRALDIRIARILSSAIPAATLSESFRPSTLSVVLYCAGIVGSVAGYSYLALTTSGLIAADVIRWMLLDKRPLVFGYAFIVAFVAFHWFMIGFFFDPKHIRGRSSEAGGRTSSLWEKTYVRWSIKALGTLLIAFLAFWWICLPAFLNLNFIDEGALRSFYDFHLFVHLSALEQIRLGALPYLEAQTQYGLGNLILMHFLTNFIDFSNHGFHAANILLNVACAIAFFVVLQRSLGFGWALAGLIGWMLWPSPYGLMSATGWAILTRWLAIPLLSLLFAHLLLNAAPGKKRTWAGPILAGAIWGIGSFLSQECFSGGILVFVLSVAMFGPTSGMQLRAVARFSGLFIASGVLVLVILVSSFVGVTHCLEVFRLANAKSGLVIAGVSNTFWSDNLGLYLTFSTVHGHLQSIVGLEGEFKPLLQTYGFAALLMVAVALLAGFLGRDWYTATVKRWQFTWKFAGVAVGAFVLHMFTLLRSDSTHLAGPSFLLPLFLLMLPLFAWHCVKPGLRRGALLFVSIGIVLQAVVAGGSAVIQKVEGIGSVWADSAAALESYRELRSFKSQSPDLANRYSPLPKHQAAFRSQRDFGETQELFGLLHDRLQGRRVELGVYKLNDLVAHPEAFYFFGGFRSFSSVTSHQNSIWLKSEEDAWINKVVNAEAACVFFEPNADSRLFEAWKNSVRPPRLVVTEPIVGKRLYGTLSCRA